MSKQFTAIINHGKKNKTIQGQFSEVLGSIAEAMLDSHVNSIIIYKDSGKIVQSQPETPYHVRWDETEF